MRQHEPQVSLYCYTERPKPSALAEVLVTARYLGMASPHHALVLVAFLFVAMHIPSYLAKGSAARARGVRARTAADGADLELPLLPHALYLARGPLAYLVHHAGNAVLLGASVQADGDEGRAHHLDGQDSPLSCIT